jgi:hypothetical protein
MASSAMENAQQKFRTIADGPGEKPSLFEGGTAQTLPKAGPLTPPKASSRALTWQQSGSSDQAPYTLALALFRPPWLSLCSSMAPTAAP